MGKREQEGYDVNKHFGETGTVGTLPEPTPCVHPSVHELHCHVLKSKCMELEWQEKDLSGGNTKTVNFEKSVALL